MGQYLFTAAFDEKNGIGRVLWGMGRGYLEADEEYGEQEKQICSLTVYVPAKKGGKQGHKHPTGRQCQVLTAQNTSDECATEV